MIKNYKFLTTIFFPLHLLTIILLALLPFELINILYFILGYIFVGGLGVGVGLHRWCSHRSINIRESAKPIVVLASLLSCQGHPIWWAALHRGYHHRYADKEKDVHSPALGKWHSFLGWIFSHDPRKVSYRYSRDLIKNPLMTTTSKYYEIIIWSCWILVAAIDLNLLLWVLLIPTVFSFHGEGMVNTFCHSSFGYRNFKTNDESRNNILLGLIFWGNGWHNNHHHRPGSYDFGKSVSGKWWEVDPCIIFLPLVRKK
jgi:fatty-acid desaturase